MGLFVGGFIGVVTLSLVAINREDKYIQIKKECQCDGNCKQENRTV